LLIIFGTRRYIEQLAMLTLSCPHCGSRSAHPLRRLLTKFTLFFIPLFVVRTEYSVQCTYCGVTSRLSKQQASELAGERVV
jgi:hypothetical protein